MLKDEIEKKINFKNIIKKDENQLVLTFETYDQSHEAATDYIKGKPQTKQCKTLKNKCLEMKQKKLILKKAIKEKIQDNPRLENLT
jgi:hypothetical protein